jgi:hypothetical protein
MELPQFIWNFIARCHNETIQNNCLPEGLLKKFCMDWTAENQQQPVKSYNWGISAGSL